jgi:peptidoglycan/xylan/chitin deacetylase (PgdA/CDA1 family)
MLPDDPQRSPNLVPVLLYHDVTRTPATRAFRRFVIPPTLFAEHLAALREAGYATGRVSELSSTPRTQQVVFVTFDDGFAGIVEHALPALAGQGMTATLYLPSAFVGGRAAWLAPEGESGRLLLSWSDVQDAVASGFEIGSHGQRHLELDMLSSSRLQRELVGSKRVLEDKTSSAVGSLAYPFGYNDNRVRSATRAAGYGTACEVGWGLHPRGRDSYRIRRFLVGPDVAGDRLAALLAEDRPTASQLVRRYSGPAWRLARRTRSSYASCQQTRTRRHD